jgi:hypothetical protein
MTHTLEASALFSNSYQQARDQFLRAAGSRGLPVQSFIHPLPGVDGELLALDVVLDGPIDASHLVLTTSGVHGIEGYAGSAAQTGLLLQQRLAASGHGHRVAILHVHAVNPHGFSLGRRVNEDNIDLNRNFIDFGQPLPANTAYEGVHDLLLPAQWPPGAELEAQLAAEAERLGPRGFQAGVSAGQYRHADGLFFGGQQAAWSNRVFRQVLRQHAAGRQHVAWIDIHTGLGPFGLGERIFATATGGPTLEAQAEQRARDWWGDITSVHTGTSTSIPLQGPIQLAFEVEAPGVLQTNICLEFGTYPPAQMLQVLRNDHRLHRHGGSVADNRAARRALREFFYPETDEWKRAIWQQSLQAVQQAVAGLAGCGG